MSEETEKTGSQEHLDAALETLLGDLEKVPALETKDIPPNLSELPPQPQDSAENTESSIDDFLLAAEAAPAEEHPPEAPRLEDALSETPAVPLEESAVSASPRPRFRPVDAPKRKRRWPWVLLFVLVALGCTGYFTRAHWKPQLMAKFGHSALSHEAPDSGLTQLSMELPAMDAEFLPPEEDSLDSADAEGEPAPEAAEFAVPSAANADAPEHPGSPAHAEPTTHHSEEAVLPKPAASPRKVTEAPEKPVIVTPQVRAMDSAIVAGISGTLQNRRVHYRCDLALFSSEGGLGRKLPDFAEPLRAVTANIFYFTVPGKTILPDIERQVLLKAGFIFPDGKLIRVEVRHLEMESVAP